VNLTAMGLLLNISKYRAEKPLRSTFQIGAKSGPGELVNGEGAKLNQYALGRGYGQYRHKPRPARKGGSRS